MIITDSARYAAALAVLGTELGILKTGEQTDVHLVRCALPGELGCRWPSPSAAGERNSRAIASLQL